MCANNLYQYSKSKQLSLVPFAPGLLLGVVVVENSFSVGLAVLEVAPPVPLPEVYPPWAASLVLHIVAFVLDPVPPEYFYVVFVNVLLPFPHLEL